MQDPEEATAETNGLWGSCCDVQLRVTGAKFSGLEDTQEAGGAEGNSSAHPV